MIKVAKEMLDIIRRAEADAAGREKMAKNSANTAVQKAAADAENFVAAAVEKARADADKIIAEQNTECENIALSAKQTAFERCDELSAIAQSNREKVAASVIKEICGK